MASPIGAAGDIIQVENPFNLKRDVAIAFKESEIAPRIINLWEFDNATL
jgi:hypothetical protein